MKVKDGELIFKKDEEYVESRKLIDNRVKEWFDICLNDIPDIIKGIGIEDKNYSFFLYFQDRQTLQIDVDLSDRSVKIIFSTGNMINPYPCIEVYDDNLHEYYSIEKVVKVEKIYPMDE